MKTMRGTPTRRWITGYFFLFLLLFVPSTLMLWRMLPDRKSQLRGILPPKAINDIFLPPSALTFLKEARSDASIEIINDMAIDKTQTILKESDFTEWKASLVEIQDSSVHEIVESQIDKAERDVNRINALIASTSNLKLIERSVSEGLRQVVSSCQNAIANLVKHSSGGRDSSLAVDLLTSLSTELEALNNDFIHKSRPELLC